MFITPLNDHQKVYVTVVKYKYCQNKYYQMTRNYRNYGHNMIQVVLTHMRF